MSGKSDCTLIDQAKMRIRTAFCVLAVVVVAGCNGDRDRRDLTSRTHVEKHEENQSQADVPLTQTLPIEGAKESIKTETDSQETKVRFISECLGPAPVDGQLLGDF
jgi:hypothetical protein